MTAQPHPRETDTPAGWSTRESLDGFTRAAWEAATSAAAAVSLLMVEIDDFGRYCDNYGSEAGELLVRRASGVIHASRLASGVHAARQAPGEFLIILPGATLDAAYIPSERILRGMRDLEIPHRGSTVSNYVTVSIGAASCRPQPGDELMTLVDAGASALWSAKRRGHNRIAAYELSPNIGDEEADSALRQVG